MRMPLAVMLALAVAAAPARPQDAKTTEDAARLMPENAQMYFDLRDLPDFHAGLSAVFGDEAVEKFNAGNHLMKMGTSFAGLLGEGDKLPKRLSGAFYGLRAPPEDSEIPVGFDMLLAYDVGDRKDAVEHVIKEIEREGDPVAGEDVEGRKLYRAAAPPTSGLPFDGLSFFQIGGTFVLGSVDKDVRVALKRLLGKEAGRGLGDLAAYATLRKAAGDGQVFVLMTGGMTEAVIALMAGSLLPDQKDPAKVLRKLMSEIGMADIEHLALAYGARDGVLSQHLVVTCPKALRGLFAIYPTPEKRLEVPAFVPADAQAFVVGAWDPEQFMKTLQAAYAFAADLGNPTPRDFIKERCGKDILTDVLGQLRGPVAVYHMPAGGKGRRPMVLVAPVGDPETVRAAYEGIASIEGVKLKRREVGGKEFFTMDSPALTDTLLMDFGAAHLHEGRVVCATGTPDDVRAVVERLGGSGKSIAGSEDFAALAKAVPDCACFIQFSRGGAARPSDALLGKMASLGMWTGQIGGVDLLSLGAGRTPWIEWAETEAGRFTTRLRIKIPR